MTEIQSDAVLESVKAKLSQAPEQVVEETIRQVKATDNCEKALKDVYFMSGLGTDERVFRLLKCEGYRPVHIHWLQPERGEAMQAYAKRLTAQIHADRPIIVGLSFGGMMAVEIAKQIETEKVILISSTKTACEVPPYFRMFRWFPIHRVFPFKSLLWVEYWIAYWFFSLSTVDERQMLKAILRDIDPHFLKWSLHQVVTWKNNVIPENLQHIHGSSDRIFLMRFLKDVIRLEKGGHLMVVNQAAEISTLLEKILMGKNLNSPVS
ncbi:alpha/beta hydrolase [Phormidium sp. CLA17]|uniref:alpha/beta hydrolase n=1 Tax=Leptolyngbya sp. Cla-17 TaxID=2803751 RepID=UPI0014911A96|nr:alpha/beta hydrolase [Leptolyngbya sp. Cla-17]MBM0742268.1 alpha/beta hydrolase [Leptolyngbya sp. Cla-17]